VTQKQKLVDTKKLPNGKGKPNNQQNESKKLKSKNSIEPKRLEVTKKDSLSQAKPNTSLPVKLPRGHLKFDDDGNIQKEAPSTTLPIPRSEYIVDSVSSELAIKSTPQSNVSNNRKGTHKKVSREPILENKSIFLKTPSKVKVKPVREYNSFPLLANNQQPQEGDLLAFEILELNSGSWAPQVNRKEAMVVSYDKLADTLTLKLDEAFLPSAEITEESQTGSDDFLTIERSDLSDVRIISKRLPKDRKIELE